MNDRSVKFIGTDNIITNHYTKPLQGALLGSLELNL